MTWELEQPLIRPPSESRSVLVRITRGCKWNRCRFCGIYPSLGEPDFSVRTAGEVKRDIDRLQEIMPTAETAFFGDSDPLQAGMATFAEIAAYLREKIPVKRLTCYARASTLYALKSESIRRLADMGLDRVHIGLESGDHETLRFHKKGQSPSVVRQVSSWLREAGIEMSFYVLLGMGGRNEWKRHILATAAVVNETEPDYLRLRRLWIYGRDGMYNEEECPLREEVNGGLFIPQTAEGTVRELALLVENLDDRLETYVVSDHQNNYFQVAGFVKEDKRKMLAAIGSFLARPEAEREAHYRAVGSGI